MGVGEKEKRSAAVRARVFFRCREQGGRESREERTGKPKQHRSLTFRQSSCHCWSRRTNNSLRSLLLRSSLLPLPLLLPSSSIPHLHHLLPNKHLHPIFPSFLLLINHQPPLSLSSTTSLGQSASFCCPFSIQQHLTQWWCRRRSKNSTNTSSSSRKDCKSSEEKND